MRGWLYGETVTRLRGAPLADPYSGDDVLGWDDPAELDVEGVGVEPVQLAATQGRNALSESRSAVTVGFTLYCEAEADILARDRVRVRGHVCRVTGEPALWRSPLTGWEPGLVVTVERVEG